METKPSPQLNSLEHLFFDMETSGFNSDVSSLHFYELIPIDPNDEGTKLHANADCNANLTQFFNHLATKIQKTAAFKQKLFRVPLGLDHPYWIEDYSFHIQDHLQHIRLGEGATWNDLMQEVSKLQNQPLDKRKPLWIGAVFSGFEAIPGLEQGQVALYLKMHHALIDGETGREIQKAIHSFEATPYEPSEENQESFSKPSAREKSAIRALIQSYPNNLRKTFSSARFITKELAQFPASLDRDTLKKVASVQKRFKLNSLSLDHVKQKVYDFVGIPTKFNPRNIGHHSSIDGRFFSLQDVKKIKTLVPGSSLSDVIFAVIAGGIHRYMKSLRDPLDFPLKVAVPINLRDDSNTSGQVMMTIHYSELFCNIDDPLERFKQTVARNKQMKESGSLKKSKSIMKFLQVAPLPMSSPLVKATAWTLGKSPLVGAHTAITNVPGVPAIQYLGNAKMVGMMGMAPVVGRIGLVHGVFSTPEQISISVTVGSKVAVDTEHYLTQLNESFLEYLNLSQTDGD